MTKVKPRHRGLSHFVAFFFAVAASLALVFSPKTGEAYVGGLVYSASLITMFGASGFYHRVTWSFRARRILRQLDHSAIFLLIAGTYTAYWTLAPPELRSNLLLGAMWGSAIFGVVAFLMWTDMHRGMRAGTYVVIGLSSLPLAINLPAFIGLARTVTMMMGAPIYILGAAVYGLRWPNPNPRVFGYHEIFHLMVILAASLQFGVAIDLHWKG